MRLNPTIARVEIGKRIDHAAELLESLRHSGVKTYEDFELAHATLLSWSTDVQSRLHTMFENSDDLIAEWQALEVGIVDVDESRMHNMKRLASGAEHGIDWLTSLQTESMKSLNHRGLQFALEDDAFGNQLPKRRALTNRATSSQAVAVPPRSVADRPAS